ncbi:helix-hairpin-helix domain-containing protein [Sphaerotilus sp.]|uniref:helix-hairpin-helix domain-containing protein n=1 Tax=Sphaerotilus sp. TaxID=2093942 RepID=UPI0034E1AAB5
MTLPDTGAPRRDAVMPSLADLCADLFATAMTPWTWATVWWQPWTLPHIRLEMTPDATAPESAPDASAVIDDLTRIEGIGPKIALKLGEAGITAFAALAATPVERLEALMASAGARFKLARPQTWPEQATLLAAGDEAGFAALAARLKGGVRA